MFTAQNIALLVLTYIWGSIPFGYILVKWASGKNILELGSGNIGSTNVKRVAGKKLSLITQLLDMLKGLAPVGLFLVLNTQEDFNELLVYALAVAAILGHNFSIFLKFKGGKGVNTTLGASVLLAPFAVFVSVGIYFLVKWRFRFVSLGSMALALTLPLADLVINGISSTFYFLLFCALLMLLTHQSNIKRLIKQKELNV